jgi:hypothetical protein
MSWEGLRLVVGVNAQISGTLIFLGFLFLFKQSPPTRRLTSKNWFWRLRLAELSGTYGPQDYPPGWARYHLLEDSGVCLNTIVDLGPKLRQPFENLPSLPVPSMDWRHKAY